MTAAVAHNTPETEVLVQRCALVWDRSVEQGTATLVDGTLVYLMPPEGGLVEAVHAIDVARATIDARALMEIRRDFPSVLEVGEATLTLAAAGGSIAPEPEPEPCATCPSRRMLAAVAIVGGAVSAVVGDLLHLSPW